MRRMTLLASLLFAVSLVAGDTPDFSRKLNARNFDSLKVENVNGSIHVRGWDENSVMIEAFIRGSAADRERINIDVQADEKQRRIAVETRHSRRYLLGFIPVHTGGKVDYEIRVPSRFDVDTESTNGGIVLHDIQGSASIETVNGALTGRSLGGRVHAESVNGSIDLEIAGARPECHIETVNGSVLIRMLSEPNCSYSLETINGRIEVPDSGVKVRGSGPKELTGELGDGSGSIHVEVINGSVTLKY